MAERPILFNGAMVREVLAGRKTQTRRLVTARTCEMGSGDFAACDLSRAWVDPGGTWIFGPGPYLKAPAQHDGEELVHRIYPRWRARDEERGEPGDLLWVRETWGIDEPYPLSTDDLGPSQLPEVPFSDLSTAAQAFWLRRLAHRATAPEADVDRWRPSIHMPRWASRITLRVTEVRVERVQSISEEDARAEGVMSGEPLCSGSHRKTFRHLWDSINAPRGFGWAANPWVWVVTFEREEPARG